MSDLVINSTEEKTADTNYLICWEKVLGFFIVKLEEKERRKTYVVVNWTNVLFSEHRFRKGTEIQTQATIQLET